MTGPDFDMPAFQLCMEQDGREVRIIFECPTEEEAEKLSAYFNKQLLEGSLNLSFNKRGNQ